jgi:hypothetical protein
MAFSIVGMIAPIVFVRREAKARAPKFGEYPSVLTASITRRRVSSITRSGEFRHLDTVAVETPANRATSSNVGVDPDIFCRPNPLLLTSPYTRK